MQEGICISWISKSKVRNVSDNGDVERSQGVVGGIKLEPSGQKWLRNSFYKDIYGIFPCFFFPKEFDIFYSINCIAIIINDNHFRETFLFSVGLNIEILILSGSME